MLDYFRSILGRGDAPAIAPDTAAGWQRMSRGSAVMPALATNGAD